MSIYESKTSTAATNIFLRQCGADLIKLSAENSEISTDNVKKDEKIKELKKKVKALDDAVTLAAKGTISSGSIKSKARELLSKDSDVVHSDSDSSDGPSGSGASGSDSSEDEDDNSKTSSGSDFAEPILKTSGAVTSSEERELHRLRAFFRE